MNESEYPPIPWPEYAGSQLASTGLEMQEIKVILDEAIPVMMALLMRGCSVELPGMCVIEVVDRPSRKVRANFRGPGAPVYETGPRRRLKLVVSERFQKELSDRHRINLALAKAIEKGGKR